MREYDLLIISKFDITKLHFYDLNNIWSFLNQFKVVYVCISWKMCRIYTELVKNNGNESMHAESRLLVIEIKY